MEASSPMELLSDIWHVFQRGLFFNNKRLSLLWGEVVKEAFPRSSPLWLPERGLHCVFVVDLEHTLKVPSPSTAVVFCCHLGRVRASGPEMMTGLRLHVSPGDSRGSIGCHPLASSGVTDWSASDVPSPGLLPSAVGDGLVGCRSGSVWGRSG